MKNKIIHCLRQTIFPIALLACVHFTIRATPYNIAPQAKVTVSSELNETCRANKMCDGLIGIENQGEWVSTNGVTYWGEISYPWLQL
ncbi:MAG: hypothetical protein LBU62_12325, partial [Bacteroidales bacterium]|nr:hypothetical protein [Bacteroidales bacterium]